MLLTTRDGQVVAGTVILEGDAVGMSVNSGHEILMRNLLEDAKPDPVKWFNSLPNTYNGSYLRARMLPDSVAAEVELDLDAAVEELTEEEREKRARQSGPHDTIPEQDLDAELDLDAAIADLTFKDGTKKTGFVTAEDNEPPRQCDHCRWMGGGSCTHPEVTADEEVGIKYGKKRDAVGNWIVNPTDCCDNIQSPR